MLMLVLTSGHFLLSEMPARDTQKNVGFLVPSDTQDQLEFLQVLDPKKADIKVLDDLLMKLEDMKTTSSREIPAIPMFFCESLIGQKVAMLRQYATAANMNFKWMLMFLR